MSNLSVLDLFQVLAWAFFGGLPLFIAYGMGHMDGEQDDSDGADFMRFISFFLVLIAQGFVIGIAYRAGIKI